MFPSAAGEYEYTRHALPEWVAFVVGWTMIVGLVVAAATVSIGFARYVGYFVDVDTRVAALGLLTVVSAIAMAGIKQSARLTVALSAVQVGGLVLVVLIGLPHVGDVDLLTGAGVGGVLGAAALVFFAFIGFDEVITLAEETRDPTRTVPRALLLALGLSATLYVAVAVAAVSVLGAAALAASPRPLADVMAHVLGSRGATVVAAIAIVTTTNTTLLALTAASRVLYGMARAGAMPRPLRGGPRAPGHAGARHRGGGAGRRRLRRARRLCRDRRRHGLRRVRRVPRCQRHRDRAPAHAARDPASVRRPGTVGGVPVRAVLGLGSVALMMTAAGAARHRSRHRARCRRPGGGMADTVAPMSRAALKGALILGAMAAGYWLALRPRHLRWGATDADLARRWPGDELVDAPYTRAVRAITVNAPAEKVWPWIMQIGRDRGGFHSYTWLENLARRHPAASTTDSGIAWIAGGATRYGWPRPRSSVDRSDWSSPASSRSERWCWCCPATPTAR